jgi:hypothetical protein
MIIPQDIKPEKSLYFLGSIVLTIFEEENNYSIDVEVLYYKFGDKFNEMISYSYFLYVLDWLYILNLIDYNKDNKIFKCF